MYYWNISALEKTLKKGHLTETAKFKYTLLSTILFSLSVLIYQLMPSNIWDIYMTFVSTAFMIGGLYVAYRLNGGSKGKDFLERLVSIYLVVFVRWFVLILLPGMVIYTILLAVFIPEIPTESSWVDLVFTTVLLLIYTLMLLASFKRLKS